MQSPRDEKKKPLLEEDTQKSEEMVPLDKDSFNPKDPEIGEKKRFIYHPKHIMVGRKIQQKEKDEKDKYLTGVDNKCMLCFKKVELCWYCEACGLYLCSGCADGKEMTAKSEGTVDVTLSVVEGCWNTEVFGHNITFSLQNSRKNLDKPILLKKPDSDIWESESSCQLEESIGIVTQPFKFKIPNVHIDELPNLKLLLNISGSDSNTNFQITSMPFDAIAGEYAMSGGSLKRKWDHCGITRKSKGNELDMNIPDSRGSDRVPILYNFSDAEMKYGFLNIECEVIGYEYDDSDKIHKLLPKDVSEKAPLLSKTFIEDIEIVKMIIRNSAHWQDFFQCLSADIFKNAFEIYLSAHWFDVIPTCIVVLSSLNELIQEGKAGNWELVKTQCEEVVAKLLQELPVNKENEEKIFDLFCDILQPEDKNDYFYLLVKNELKVFPSKDSFFDGFVQKFWRVPSAEIACCRVSLKSVWISNLISFIIFLILLSLHIFVVDPRPQLLLNEAMINMLGESDTISDFSSYTDWFRNTLFPALYDSSDNHLYLLTDDVIVRLIRIPPINCNNPESIPFLNEIKECYPRATNTFYNWNPEPWHNFTVMDIGKNILGSPEAIYDSRGNTIILSRNESIAEDTLNDIDFDNWLDWSIQAVIIEFAMYSPNLQLFSMCAIVSEFSNVGTFEMSSECTIVSPKELSLANSLIDVFLYIFLSAFLVEEAWELFRILRGIVPITRFEKQQAEQYFEESLFVGFYTYVTEIWNVLDLIMIISGFVGLAYSRNASAMVQTFSLQELWQVEYTNQISGVFLSICVVIAYFRFLNFLTHLEYVGVLVLTVFYMMTEIVRFMIIFIFISLGFSAAFHILYKTDLAYSTWQDSLITTTLGLFSGYTFPDYYNLLIFPYPIVGYIFQVAMIIIGIVLLLNFLIAMMSTIYDNFHENSTTEFRWAKTREITRLGEATWPIPFNIIQFVLYPCCACCTVLITIFLCDPAAEVHPEFTLKEKESLFAEMVRAYFRAERPEYFAVSSNLQEEKKRALLHRESRIDLKAQK
jgi:hypothetical protein